MATGLRGVTRLPSINDKRNERNARLVKARKRSSQLSKMAADAMSHADPISSAFSVSDRARDVAHTEIDAGVAKELPLRHSLSSDGSARTDMSRQVRVDVEIYDVESQRVIHTFDYLDYIDPTFDSGHMEFPDEISIRESELAKLNGVEFVNEPELGAKSRVREAGGSEDNEFEANFVISVRKKSRLGAPDESPISTTMSSSGAETKTVTRVVKFIDDSGRTVSQSRESFTFKGIRKGGAVTWSNESYEFGAVSVFDNDDFIIESPGEKLVVTPDSPNEVLTEVRVLPKRTLDTASREVVVNAFINAHGVVFKQEPVRVSVAFQTFRSDEHDELDVLDPVGTIERAVKQSYRGSDFGVKSVDVDIQSMVANVELSMREGESAAKTDRATAATGDRSAVDSRAADGQMSEFAARFGPSFVSSHVSNDFSEPSDHELDALYEAHLEVTDALVRTLNESRAQAGLNEVSARVLNRDDVLALYEWAADASLKQRTSKSRVLNDVIQKLGSTYDSELLMNTRTVRATCSENDIADQLMGSVRQAEQAGSRGALMSDTAAYATVAVLVSNVSETGDSMRLSASVVMTR